jgi:hypothetical protein
MSESPDSTLPDTAMATGNDQGEPGERSTGGPLDAEDRQLLEALEHPVDAPAEPAAEDAPEVASAVADDAPLPPAGDHGGVQDDGLTPEFTDQ